MLHALVGFALVSCKDSLDVESGPNLPSILEPTVTSPTIASPAGSPFYSSASSLQIQGLCTNGALVLLSGPSNDQVICSSSQYSFTVNQSVDGSYNYFVTQRIDGSDSAPVSLLWVRKSSVSQPALTNPLTNPYLSAETVISVDGSCETGSTIILSQDAAGETTCSGSSFSINVTQFVDGDYTVEVTQRDLAGNEASTSFVWQKRALSVVPNDPQIIVTNSVTFLISGGSGAYTTNFLANNSGGTFDSGSLLYTAGTTAGVTDQIEVMDGQGFTEVIDIQVIPDLPDHFEFPTPSGDSQNILIGNNFAEPLIAQISDQYGNPVPNVSVIFQNTAGDVELLDSPIQVSDSQGLVQMNARQGYTAERSQVGVLPVGANFPDNASTGNPTLVFQALSQFNNSGNFDLVFNVANSPEDIVVADLTGDGIEEVLVLNKGPNSISVLTNTGNGILSTLTTILSAQICSGASSLYAGLIDADSNQDLLLSCTGSGSGEYSFLSGRGDGSFDPAVNVGVSLDENLPVDIALGDFNGDTFLDMAMVSAGTGRLAVRFGGNDGTFAAPAIYLTDSSPSKVIAADVDNQDGPDLIVVNAGQNNFGVYINNGSGGFSAATTYGTGVAPSGIQVVDFNSDGFSDVAITNNVDNNLFVFLNNLDGTFNLGIPTSTGLNPTDLRALHLNGDSFIDLAVSNVGDSTISILFGSNNGTFVAQTPMNSLTNPISLSDSDFNSDSRADLVVVSSGEAKIQVIPGQADGTLGFLAPVGNNAKSSFGGDFNGDGIRDKAVITQGFNEINLLRGLNNGLFSSLANLSTGGNTPSHGIAADLDRDGNLDIVVSASSGIHVIRVFPGLGGGAFGTHTDYFTQTQPREIVAKDFNRDGNIDIVVTNSGSDSISFFPGNGDGTLGTRADFGSGGAQPVAVDAGDFNGDQIPDLAVANQSGGNVGVLISNGDGTFQSAVSNTAQAGSNGVVVGFFNADAIPDFAVSNNLAASVTVHMGMGNGNFGTGTSYFAGFDPAGIGKGDFNNDGREDFAIPNGINQTVTLMFGSITGNYSSNQTLTTRVNSVSIEVDDLNQDGAADLSVVDGTNPFLKVFLGN